MQLLAIRHQDDLQLIDPRYGDLGLEAFTRGSGLGFQCYAAQEPISAKERYEKQRDKLTRDLRKLEENEQELDHVLGATRLSRYVFMVTEFDVRLLEHCGRQCTKIKAKNLVILSDLFEIVVHTEENYPLESAQLIEQALHPLDLDIDDVDREAQAAWEAANVPLVETLSAKIAKFNLPAAQGNELRDEFLSHYLRREQLLEQVFDEAPDTHVRLVERIRQRERLLAIDRLMGKAPPLEHARGVIRELASELLRESRALQPSSADALAYGTAADWMVRCPLDFN